MQPGSSYRIHDANGGLSVLEIIFRRAACAVVLLLCACASRTTQIPSLIERARPIAGAADERELLRIAGEVERRVLHGERLHGDATAAAYVQSVTDHLLRAAGAPSEVRARVRITRKATPDAFVLVNGALYVSTGLLARLENEAQLAALLGHELTHYLRRDTLRMERARRDATITQALEIEADLAGLELMAAAGYRPDQAAEAYRRLLPAVAPRSQRDSRRASSHPRLADRIARIDAAVVALFGERSSTGFEGRAQYAASCGALVIPVSATEDAPAAPWASWAQ